METRLLELMKERLKMGYQNGQGTQTWSDGSKYVGEWKDGERNGQGTYIFSDDDKENWRNTWYVGEWKNNVYHGKGTLNNMFFEYEGEWRDGKKHGQGIETPRGMEPYIGEWKNGEKWNVKRTSKDGNIISEYLNGKQIKPLYSPLKQTPNKP